MKNTGNFKVITPAGNIYVDTAREAAEYKQNYGYPYVRNLSESEYNESRHRDEMMENDINNQYD
jgi:hypothetical protein